MPDRPLEFRRADELFHALARTLYLGAGLVVLLWFLHQIQRVVLVLLLAIILALALNAPVTWLEKEKGLSRGIATLATFLAIAVFTAGVLWVIVPRLVEEVPALIQQVPELAQQVGEEAEELLDHPEIARQLDQVVNWALGLVGGIWRHADTALTALLTTIFTVALVLYLVANPRPLLAGYLRAMPPSRREAATRAFSRSGEMVVGWIVSNVILGGLKAGASFAMLTFLGVPGALIWSLTAFVAALIPPVGFYLMAVPPVLMALTISPTTALWLALFYWALSEFLGNFVAPKIRERTMRLHPAYLLFMTLAMAYAFGIVGVVISAPVAGFLYVYYQEFFLRERPEDPESDRRVEEMMRWKVLR